MLKMAFMCEGQPASDYFLVILLMSHLTGQIINPHEISVNFIVTQQIGV